MALEWLWDARQRTGIYRLGDTLTNLGCGVMDQTTGLFAKVLTIAAFTAVYELRIFDSWPSGAAGFALAFVAGDFAYYWSHRWSHRVNLFWIGHVVHHQSEDYNLGVALRQSAAQKVLMMWVYWPLALVGMPPELFASVMAFNLLYQFWIHTESIRSLGPFEWVLNSPSHHRVHHGRNPEYIDRNHGGVFIVWDRLFGTFAAETIQPTYGITVPTATFNPVRAQLQPWIRLARQFRTMPTAADKFRLLFSPPGWAPDSLGGPVAAPAISGEEMKYHVEPDVRLLPALLTRWGVALVLAVGLLLVQTAFPGWALAAGVLWVLGQLWWVGAMWDGQEIHAGLGIGLDLGIVLVAFTSGLPVFVVAGLFTALALLNLQWLSVKRRVSSDSTQR